MEKAITIDQSDNIAVSLIELSEGEVLTVGNQSILLKNNISVKHKFALNDIRKGDNIIMYGIVVGEAKDNIQEGAAVTTQNVSHKTSSYDLIRKTDYQWKPPDVSKWRDATFMGYHRSDGQVGTANYWLVFPLVFCENRNIEVLKNTFYKVLGFEKKSQYVDYLSRLASEYFPNKINVDLTESSDNTLFRNIDGIKFLTHQGGCGGTREDAEILCRLLAGYVNNPNVAGATVLSLGCQNAQVQLFKDCLHSINPNFNKPIIILDQQQIGTEEELMEKAISRTFKGLVEANKIERSSANIDKLTIGLECGGSDGFSGISANPTLGKISDIITTLGGKAILSEFPELCGVEQELINRIISRDKAVKFIELMRNYEKSALNVGSGFDMNPSPGNIRDGLITDAMKSAGAAKKGGNSPIQDILDYTEYVSQAGLNLLCTPGNDVESTTGLAGSGANIILFTTGLGTPTGNPIVPVIKVSSNTRLEERMPDIIDFDTGPIIKGEKTISEMADKLLNLVIEIASGNKKSKATMLQQDDFIPWKRGVSL